MFSPSGNERNPAAAARSPAPDPEDPVWEKMWVAAMSAAWPAAAAASARAAGVAVASEDRGGARAAGRQEA
jgi:hypothetical protein